VLRRLPFVLALLCVAWTAAPATASVGASATSAVQDPEVGYWLDRAAAYWGGDPRCPAGIDVSLDATLPAGEVARATVGGCDIRYSTAWYPRPSNQTWAAWAEQLCIITVHEYGHLLGRAHTSDPDDIMNPNPTFVPTGCRAADQPGAATVPKDTSPPRITLVTPGQNQRIPQHSTFSLSYTCTDEVDGTGATPTGVATCTGPALMDTDALGPHTYTLTATDRAGNTATLAFTYVVYAPGSAASSTSSSTGTSARAAAPTAFRTTTWRPFAVPSRAFTGRVRTRDAGGGRVRVDVALLAKRRGVRPARLCVRATGPQACVTARFAGRRARASIVVPFGTLRLLVRPAGAERTRVAVPVTAR
jgi:hypothetical protein